MKVGTRGFGRYGECRVVAVEDSGDRIQIQYADGEVCTVQNDGSGFAENVQLDLGIEGGTR